MKIKKNIYIFLLTSFCYSSLWSLSFGNGGGGGAQLGDTNTWTAAQTFTTSTATNFFAGNGTAANPSYSFTNLTGYGFYTDASSKILLGVGGLAKGAFSANGQAAFGTTTLSSYGRLFADEASTGVHEIFPIVAFNSAAAGVSPSYILTRTPSGGSAAGIAFGPGSSSVQTPSWSMGASSSADFYLSAAFPMGSSNIFSAKASDTSMTVTSMTVTTAGFFTTHLSIPQNAAPRTNVTALKVFEIIVNTGASPDEVCISTGITATTQWVLLSNMGTACSN